MVEKTRLRPFAVAFACNAVLLLCLLAPSAWMIVTVPPLWRDVDAYIQLTQDPRITTFWGHAPAYGYLAKVPLFLGEQWERWRGIAVANPESGLSTLTDTGVWLLIIAQHLALTSAAFYFIVAISRSFWVRLALSLVWASCALFYTFAHCVGSESLSLILMVFVAAKGLRLISPAQEPHWKDWYLFAVALSLCLLSRHVNILLIFLLPTAFLLSWILTTFSIRFAAIDPQKRRQRTSAFHHAMTALAIGISCLLVASSLPHLLARKTNLHPHSRMGYTFLFRLQFLKELPPAARLALLEKVAPRTKSTEARRLVTLLGQMHEETANMTAEPFTRRAIPVLFPDDASIPWEKLDVALNDMALAFLLPPTPELLHAARNDFCSALKMPVTAIVDNLFETTGYFFEHRNDMSGCAGLITFRDSSAEAIARIPTEHPYFYLWRGVTGNHAFILLLIALSLLVVIARRRKENFVVIPLFAVSLTGIGLLVTATNCLLTEFLPRFVAPLWLLLLLSFLILAGSAADLVRGKSAGQLCRPEP
jgi:hypothetical protein